MIELIKPGYAPDGYKIFTTTNSNGADFNIFNSKSLAHYSSLKEQLKHPKMITLNQQHKGKVIRVHPQNYLVANGASADGLFTVNSGIAVGILTADCYPVVVIGHKGAAALHCGWKSIVAGIIENSMKLFDYIGDTPNYAYIGSGISQKHFEVKIDFIEKIAKITEPSEFLLEINNKYYFDLQGLIQKKLDDLKISNIELSKLCTYSSPKLHSHRRDGVNSGRMLTALYKEF